MRTSGDDNASGQGNAEAVEYALKWVLDGSAPITESYVNLIPTAQGTHVNGLRSGLIDALKEFCEFRDLLPRGVKITGDDIWDQRSYVLSVKLLDPSLPVKQRSDCLRVNQRSLSPESQGRLQSVA